MTTKEGELSKGDKEPKKIVVVTLEFDREFTRSEDVHKAEVRPAVVELEKKCTAEAIVALMWMQEKGKRNVPAGNIEELIQERRRGLETLGVKDLDETIYTTAKDLVADRSTLHKRTVTFFRKSRAV